MKYSIIYRILNGNVYILVLGIKEPSKNLVGLLQIRTKRIKHKNDSAVAPLIQNVLYIDLKESGSLFDSAYLAYRLDV